MAVTFRSSSSAHTGSAAASSLQLTIPAGVQSNDALFAAISVDGGTGAAITPPSGWTQIGTIDQTTNLKLRVYWRLANGQEAAQYTWTFDTTRMASGAVVAYSDASLFVPSSVGIGSSGTASATLTPTTTQSSYSGRAITFWGTRNTTAAATLTPAASYTEREDISTTASTFVGLQVQDIVKTYPMGGTVTSTSTATQTVTQCNIVVLLEDLHLTPFSDIAIDSFQCGSITASAATLGTSKFATNYPNEVILAFIAVNKDVQTVSSISNTSGLTWTNVARANTQSGSVELWRAFAPTPITNQTITATFSANVVSANSLVMGIVGADISTPGVSAIGATQTASGTSSTPTVSVTTTRDRSLVVGIWNNPSQNSSTTAGTNQTILRAGNDSTNTCVSAMNIRNAVTPTAGTSVAINSTVSMTAWNALAVEVLPTAKKHPGMLGVG